MSLLMSILVLAYDVSYSAEGETHAPSRRTYHRPRYVLCVCSYVQRSEVERVHAR